MLPFMRFYRRWTNKQYFFLWVSLTTFLIFYIEFYSYLVNTQTWLKPKCGNSCIKILLVADPQIIGERKELIPLITPISIWDSDFFLRKTFYHAYNFIQPNVIIFLGDLMDEGSIATAEEFRNYVRRIYRIFTDHSVTNVKHIWLPGDNDIGGENFDQVTDVKLKRFHRAFPQPELIDYSNVTFFKINRFIQSIPVFKSSRNFYDPSRVFVGLSHLPLMFVPSPFVEKVIRKMAPQLLFTAHEHKSMIISTNALLHHDYHITPVTPTNTNIYEYSLGLSDMYEIIIPTCSYRMGTDKVGFGYAIIEKNELRYTVLWSPSRFTQLYYYFVYVCFSLLGFCVLGLCCRGRTRGNFL